MDSVLFELDESIKTRSFAEPTKAIEYLKGRELISFVDKYLKSCKDQEDLEEIGCGNVEHSYVDVDFFSIHKEAYNRSQRL